MFPLPAQLFRPFSLENSQWHPVRFASWFICHISFISLNSLYLSSGSMHLSWVPQQCLQARSKHILHVTPQLRARLFHPGCVGSMKNWLSDAVNFYSSHHQVFLALSVSGVAMHLAGCFSFPFFLLLSSGLCQLGEIARGASLWPGKGCFVEDEWLTQLGEYGNDVMMPPRRQVKTNLFMKCSWRKRSSLWGWGVLR